MTREILFRGKRKDNDEWVYGFLICMNYIDVWEQKVCYDGQEEIKYCTTKSYQVIPETVSQFTGLVDKHGKKIFEGDIIAKGFELYEVRWNPEQVRWGIYSDNYEVAGFTKFSESYFEVVGNVYDNKELLKND